MNTSFAFVMVMGWAACSQGGTPEEVRPRAQSAVERGQYLVTVGGCNDCHTPLKLGPNGPEPDLTRMLSGHPASLVMPPPPPPSGPWQVASAGTNTAHAGPWGVSFTANLTPDKDTGIGAWSVDTFMATIRNGRHMGAGRPLNPPMPWFNYAKMTDEDLRSVYDYLRSIPAISNKVPEPISPPTAMLQGGV
jgi:hypothetical protein